MVNKIKNLGFTLFEMVLVVGIIAILSGISFTYYSKFAEGRKLEGEAKKISNSISLGLKNATSANQESCNNFVGFNILMETSNNRWFLQRCCNSSSSCTDVATYDLEKNIEIYSTSPSPLTSIFFNILGRGVVFNSNSSTQIGRITLKNLNLETKNCIDVNINKAGVVDIGERIDCI